MINLIKKIWNVLAGTTLTFWLLILIVATLITGSVYSKYDYHFFDLLNNNTLQNWFAHYGSENLVKSWWLIALFGLMMLLAVNIFACTTERIRVLLPKRHAMSGKTFFTLLTPSLIHISFIFTLIGHIITYTTIEHVRYPIDINSEVVLPNKEKIKVMDIKPINYGNTTYLSDRLRDAEVTIQFESKALTPVYKIHFLKPLFVNGIFFHIDVAKSREAFKKPEPGTSVCNRAEVKQTETEMPQFYLLYTDDPGLYIIMTFIFIISLLMLWYYLNVKKLQKGQVLH